MPRRLLTYAAALALVLLPHGPSLAGNAERIVVIAHKARARTTSSRSDLRPIFQTRTDSWPSGELATPFNLPVGDDLRHGFDAAVLGLDPERVTRYWIDRQIRGGARPPKQVPNESLMLKVVSRTPGAVGYVSEAIVDDSVAVVAHVVNGQVVAP